MGKKIQLKDQSFPFRPRSARERNLKEGGSLRKKERKETRETVRQKDEGLPSQQKSRRSPRPVGKKEKGAEGREWDHGA